MLLIAPLVYSISAFSQTTTTIDYLNSNNLDPSRCNVFFPPVVKVNNVIHYSHAGGVLFSSNLGIQLSTTPKVTSSTTNNATAFIINYDFKPNYTYSYSITAEANNTGFTIKAQVPTDMNQYPTNSNTSCIPDQNVWTYSANGLTSLTALLQSTQSTTYSSNTFSIPSTTNLSSLLVWATGGDANLSLDVLTISKITITETPPPLSFSISPTSIAIAPCQTVTQNLLVNQSGTTTGTVTYNWKLGTGWSSGSNTGNFTTTTNSIPVTNTPNLSSYGNIVVDILVNGVVTSTQTCNVSKSASTFTFSPEKFEVNCGQAKTQTFSVAVVNADYCTLSYVWTLGNNNGWQYGTGNAPTTITTSTNTLTLTTSTTAANISDVSVNVLVNGISVATYNCGSSIITPTYNYSISGRPVTCNSEIYTVPGLPSGATVAWSVVNAPTFTLSQNTPATNQVTVTNNKYYGTTVNLYASITGLSSCPAPYKIAKQISNDNETSINKSFNYSQEACSYYNVNHNALSGSIISNAAPVFVHQGCMVYVGLGDLKGATVSVNPQPTYWSTGTTSYFSGTTLMFNLGLYTGGIPYTFKISNNNNGACFDNRTLLFFSMSANGRFANPNRFVISKHPSLANTLTIGLNQTTSDEIARLFFDATALQAEQVQSVNIYNQDGTKVLQADNIATQVTNLDVSTLSQGVYTIEVFGNNDYKELQTFQYVTTGTEEQLAENTATDNLNIFGTDAAAIVNVLHQELYQRLRENTDLLNNSTTLQSFFLAQQQSGLETIEQINSALSNYDVTTAQTLINNWLPTTQLELNCLQYYNFFIKYLNGGTFTNTEISDLYGLANLCPQTNGEIIFAARSLYNYVTQLDEHFSYACGNNLARGIKKVDMATAKFGVNAISIYPNPAKDNFSIKFPASTKGINTIKVLDMFGKTIIQQNTISGTQHINITQTLATGIYTVQITNSVTGKTETQKLIIQ